MPVTRRSLNLQPSISSRVPPPRPHAKRSQANGVSPCMQTPGRSFPGWCAVRPLGGGRRPLLESDRALRSLAGLPSDGDLRSLAPGTPQRISLTHPTSLLHATLSGSEVGCWWTSSFLLRCAPESVALESVLLPCLFHQAFGCHLWKHRVPRCQSLPDRGGALSTTPPPTS